MGPAWAWPRTRRGLTGAVASIILIGALLVAFSHLLTGGRQSLAAKTPTALPHPTSTPTATPEPTVVLTTGSLTWRSVALPPHFPQRIGMDVLTVAPSDGRTAYACFHPSPPLPASPQTPPPVVPPAIPQLWVTHDRATTWHEIALSPYTHEMGQCYVQIDQLDPNIAVVGVAAPPSQQAPTGLPRASLLTTDGGVTWRSLPVAGLWTSLHTEGGVTYAQRHIPDGASVRTEIMVSHDGMATWQTLTSPSGYTPMSFWAQPGSGVLLSLYNTGDVGWELWGSRDGGATWRQWASREASGWVVRGPAHGEAWLVCAIPWDTSTAFDPANRHAGLLCTSDGGATWRQRPPLPAQAKMPSYVIAADGSILSYGLREADGMAPMRLYHLAPAASGWDLLAEVPQAQFTYARGPGAGILWMGPGFNGGGQYQGRFFTTDYPAS